MSLHIMQGFYNNKYIKTEHILLVGATSRPDSTSKESSLGK